ncbi:MAG: Na+/H+ antiporter subunit E [Spirochaetaceae bacterium]
MKSFLGRVFLLLFLCIIWVLLTYPIDTQEVLAGGVVALLLAVLPLGSIPVFSEIRWNPKSLVYAVIYLFIFFFELIKSNIDVAFRVLHPTLPISPGIVKVRTRLQSRMGRMALANSITLTPGTITVETKGEYFYIHWIDVRARNIEETTENIVSKFEKYLEVIFG